MPGESDPADQARGVVAARQVVAVAVCAALGMMFLELMTGLVFPGISGRMLQWLTIGFTAVIASAAAAWTIGVIGRLSSSSMAAFGARQESERRALDAEHQVAVLQMTSAAQARFSALVEHSADVIMITDAMGRVSYESPGAQRVSGFARGSRGTVNALGEIHPEDQLLAQSLLGGILAEPGSDASTEFRIRHQDGRWLWVEVRGTNLLEDPAVNGVVINYRDITERRLAEDAVRDQGAALRLLASVATAANTAISVHDALRSCLTALCAYTGWAVAHAYLVVDTPEPQLVSSGAWHDNDARRYAAFAHATRGMRFGPGVGLPGHVLATGEPLWGVDLGADERFGRADCARAAGLTAGCFLPAYENDKVVAVLEFFDRGCPSISPELADLLGQVGAQVGRVVARESAAARLNHEVLHDALTDLPNRRLFKKRVEQALTAARDHRHQVAVLVLDLDWFKTINDSLGHDIGDGILLEVADRLRRCMRPGDTVARLGGDEFAFLLADVTHNRDGYPLANRILDVLRLPFRVHDTLLAIQGSIGIALSDPDDPRHPGAAGDTDTADHLLRNADVAMYRAKAAGRGQVLSFTPAMHESARLRLELGGDLPRALAAGEFAVHYQPKIALASGRITGTEALVRWNHPRQGLIPPGRVHPDRGGDGVDRRPRGVGAQPGLPADRRVATVGRRLPRSHRRGQPVRQAVRSRADPDRRRSPATLGSGREPAHPGDHREPAARRRARHRAAA